MGLTRFADMTPAEFRASFASGLLAAPAAAATESHSPPASRFDRHGLRCSAGFHGLASAADEVVDHDARRIAANVDRRLVESSAVLDPHRQADGECRRSYEQRRLSDHREYRDRGEFRFDRIKLASSPSSGWRRRDAAARR